MTKQLKNSLLLVLTALIWGIAFVAQSKGGDAVGPYSFNCIRSFIGAGVLIPVMLLLDKAGFSPKKPETKEEKRITLIGGVCCGIPLFVASNLQQMGIYLGSEVGKAGFLTACYILFVPIIGLFLKKKCGWNIWVGVLLTVIGLYLLCASGDMAFRLSDLLLILCAVMFAVQIIMVDKYSPICDGVRLSAIQFFVSGVLGLFPTIFLEMKPFAGGFLAWFNPLMTWDAWAPILYAGIMSCGVAYTLQIIGQDGVNPTIASMLMSLESVFAVLAGAIILHEYLTIRELMGCVLIFVAIIIAQISVDKQCSLS